MHPFLRRLHSNVTTNYGTPADRHAPPDCALPDRALLCVRRTRFAHMHLHDSVSLEDLERRPQTVRLFCLLHADGVDITIARKAVLKAMKLSECQVTHNAASVKTARDFVKQLTNRDDRKKGRNSRA